MRVEVRERARGPWGGTSGGSGNEAAVERASERVSGGRW